MFYVVCALSLTMQVAYKLMVMHEGCLEGTFQSIERLRETNQQKADVHHVRQVIISRNLALNHLWEVLRVPWFRFLTVMWKYNIVFSARFQKLSRSFLFLLLHLMWLISAYLWNPDECCCIVILHLYILYICQFILNSLFSFFFFFVGCNFNTLFAITYSYLIN